MQKVHIPVTLAPQADKVGHDYDDPMAAKKFALIVLLTIFPMTATAQDQDVRALLRKQIQALGAAGFTGMQDVSIPAAPRFVPASQRASGEVEISGETPPTQPVVAEGGFTEGPCPSTVALFHETGTNANDPGRWRCYFDQDGRLHHWATLHHVQHAHDSFWWGPSVKYEDKIVVGYSRILRQQEEYNKWLKANTKPKAEIQYGQQWPYEDKTVDVYPYPVIPENGRLTADTMLIPYYRSAEISLALGKTFFDRCREAAGSRRAYCAEQRSTGEGEEFLEYPNLPMLEWACALRVLRETREEFKRYVRNYFFDVHQPSQIISPKDWVDCQKDDLASCAVEVDAIPYSVSIRIDMLVSSIASQAAGIQKLRNDYEQRASETDSVPNIPAK